MPTSSEQRVTCGLHAARAVALGYNVMVVDSDTVVMADFYSRVKAWPYSAYSMISQSEASADAVNGGFTYVHNASRTGPTAYLLFSVVYRTAR